MNEPARKQIYLAKWLGFKVGICWLVSGILPCTESSSVPQTLTDHRTRVSVVAP